MHDRVVDVPSPGGDQAPAGRDLEPGADIDRRPARARIVPDHRPPQTWGQRDGGADVAACRMGETLFVARYPEVGERRVDLGSEPGGAPAKASPPDEYEHVVAPYLRRGPPRVVGVTGDRPYRKLRSRSHVDHRKHAFRIYADLRARIF